MFMYSVYIYVYVQCVYICLCTVYIHIYIRLVNPAIFRGSSIPFLLRKAVGQTPRLRIPPVDSESTRSLPQRDGGRCVLRPLRRASGWSDVGREFQ